MWQTWQLLVKYPTCLSKETIAMLSTLESILPTPQIDSNGFTDRFTFWLAWLGDAKRKGLISSSEYHALQADLARNI